MRAFDAGWGGAVWKTIGDPIRNVTARLGTFDYGGKRIVGINNIELISDRPTDVNIAEIREVKKRYPNHAVVISLMVEAQARGLARDHRQVQRHRRRRRTSSTSAARTA